MSPRPFEDITPEVASALIDQIKKRLPERDFSIGAAAADVFEVRLPDGVDLQALDQRILQMGSKLLAKSFE